MKTILVLGVLAAAVFVYFHAPNGDLIGVDPAGGQIVVRPSPPGYPGRTMIETGVGNEYVIETPCEVIHALEHRKCPRKD